LQLAVGAVSADKAVERFLDASLLALDITANLAQSDTGVIGQTAIGQKGTLIAAGEIAQICQTVRALGERTDDCRMVFVTRDATDAAGIPASNPADALAFGLAGVAPKEYPNVSTVVIDVDGWVTNKSEIERLAGAPRPAPATPCCRPGWVTASGR